jgi:TrmH family RNA methyltransferase
VRAEQGRCLLEGPELVLAGLAAGRVDAVFFDAEATETSPRARRVLEAARDAGVVPVGLAPGVLRKVTDAVNPQPVVATSVPPLSGPDALGPSGFVLVLSDVADPGNLGTAIRSADAAGGAGVVVCGAGVDVCNPKALRATAGSAFQIPLVVLDELGDALDVLHATGREVLGAVVRDAPSLWSTTLSENVAVVVGAEASGLGVTDLGRLDGAVRIPMEGSAESLNAGVAASIVCFEALRQRTTAQAGPHASPTI